jgi:hypothetical protein
VKGDNGEGGNMAILIVGAALIALATLFVAWATEAPDIAGHHFQGGESR